jgi:hypothetical protein
LRELGYSKSADRVAGPGGLRRTGEATHVSAHATRTAPGYRGILGISACPGGSHRIGNRRAHCAGCRESAGPSRADRCAMAALGSGGKRDGRGARRTSRAGDVGPPGVGRDSGCGGSSMEINGRGAAAWMDAGRNTRRPAFLLGHFTRGGSGCCTADRETRRAWDYAQSRTALAGDQSFGYQVPSHDVDLLCSGLTTTWNLEPETRVNSAATESGPECGRRIPRTVCWPPHCALP